MPKRIQRRRTKGWRMPEGAVYVGRPSRWGNPWRVARDSMGIYVLLPDGGLLVEVESVTEGREVATAEYRLHTGPMGSYELDAAEVRRELAGRDLVCWCPESEPCHADVLLEIANTEVA